MGEVLEAGMTGPEIGQNSLLERLPEAARVRVREKLKDFLVLLERLRCGQRVPSDGDAVWLFDYGAEETEKLGHGVYTNALGCRFMPRALPTGCGK